MHHLLVFNIIDQIRTLGWPGFWSLLRNGIVSGSLLALIALGYTMVYGILQLLNFAHGDIYMVGAFIGYGVLQAFGGATAATFPIVPLISALGVLFFLESSVQLLTNSAHVLYEGVYIGGNYPSTFGPLLNPV